MATFQELWEWIIFSCYPFNGLSPPHGTGALPFGRDLPEDAVFSPPTCLLHSQAFSSSMGFFHKGTRLGMHLQQLPACLHILHIVSMQEDTQNTFPAFILIIAYSTERQEMKNSVPFYCFIYFCIHNFFSIWITAPPPDTPTHISTVTCGNFYMQQGF